ncbi:metal-sulfur cluster assembly factor [Ramlibacter sp.]|uniref:metal-sulfur cluster assembly factor n=1 Tax=Ramlibacter sp. TaxID=1917967 RepID=UPI0035B06FF9
MKTPYPYDGPAEWQEPVENALREVTDPEVGLNIVDVGLVYGVTVQPQAVTVRITMTSAACPLGDVIMEDVAARVTQALPAGTDVRVELVWEPPWTPERLSDHGRQMMGW